jgi:hypothetical protein
MFLLTRVRTNSHLKRLAGGVEKRLKKSLLASMQRFIQAPAPETIDSLEDINSIFDHSS